METVYLGNCSPFVRFSRFQKVPEQHGFPVCAYDSRLFYCIKGKGKLKLADKAHDVRTGTLFLWMAGVPYRFFPDENFPMEFLALNFDFTDKGKHLTQPIEPDREENFKKENMVENISFADAEILNFPLVMDGMDSVYGKLCEIHSEFTLKTEFFRERCSGLLLNILASAANSRDKKMRKTNDIIKSAVTYMNENLGKSISNKEIGKALGYHPNYLNSIFVAYTGKTLHRYLLDIRIQNAVDMLRETSLSVAEIASISGFGDYAHFSKYFKQETGYPPSKFRLD